MEMPTIILIRIALTFMTMPIAEMGMSDPYLINAPYFTNVLFITAVNRTMAACTIKLEAPMEQIILPSSLKH